jgi:hypothetical protein
MGYRRITVCTQKRHGCRCLLTVIEIWKNPSGNSQPLLVMDAGLKSAESNLMAYSQLVSEALSRVQIPRISVTNPPVKEELIQDLLKASAGMFEDQNANAEYIRALLLLQAGDLDHSHKIVQQLDDQNAAYIHGMIHRVEGDFSNANYWFRKAGRHPALEKSQFDALQLTNQVERGLSSALSKELIETLSIEFKSLLDFLVT